MKILKITKLKNGKYKIKLDNNTDLITYDDIILKHNIILKKEINMELIDKIYSDTLQYESYSKVLKFIGLKMRSKLEIEKYLDKLGVDDSDKEKIISKLEGNGLVNDKNYIQAFIADKINLTIWGPNKIKKELLSHNIDERIIDEELSKYNEDIYIDRIDKIITKKLKSNKHSAYIFKQKLTNELINLGYELSLIKERLENVKIEDRNVLENDFHKIYKRLSKKFEGDELLKQIKNRLLAKGYKLDEINDFLNTYEP